MQLQNLLTPERTFCRVTGASKKRVIESITRFIHTDQPTLDPDDLFEHLVAREKLGSTGLGNGIAIPHCRVKSCSSITGCLLTLEQAVDFDAIDGQPVDIVFALLVPEEAHDDHLQALAQLAQRFSDPDYCSALRAAENKEDLYHAAIT